MQEAPIRNRLLAALPPEVAGAVLDCGEPIELPISTQLYEQDEPVRHVILPESGVISMLIVMRDGLLVEAAMVGREGMAGYPLTAQELSPWRAIVQVEGAGLRVPVDEFKRLVDESPPLRALLDGFAATLLAFSAQSTACNRFHELNERLARWLLMTHDRAGRDDFHLTHEFLAQMLGAHRPSVTVAMRALQRAGLIERGRGSVRILDREGLEAAACECYRRIRGRYDALLPG